MSASVYTEDGFFVVLGGGVGLSIPTPYDIFDHAGAVFGTAAFRDFIGANFDPTGDYSDPAFDASPYAVTQPPLDDGAVHPSPVNRHIFTPPSSSAFPVPGPTGLPFKLVFSSPAGANATGNVDHDVQPETMSGSDLSFAWGFLTTLPDGATNVNITLTFHGTFHPSTPGSGSGVVLGKVNQGFRGGVTNGPDAYPGDGFGEASGGILVGPDLTYFVGSTYAFSGRSFFTNYIEIGPAFSYGHPGDEYLIDSVSVKRRYTLPNVPPTITVVAHPHEDLVPLITTVTAEVLDSYPDPANPGFTITANTKIVSYSWTAGDGNPPQVGPSPSYRCSFPTVGDHVVTCAATTTKGDVVTGTVTVTALPLPIAPPPPSPPPADPPPYSADYSLTGTPDKLRVDFE